MKNIIFLLLANLTFLCCKAQSPILNMEIDTKHDAPNGSYYKDVNNVLNDFEGIWLYANGSTSLKIKLVKKNMYHYQAGTRSYYQDLLIGGYQYIENGEEKINTLTDANDLNLGYSASIKGNNVYNSCKYLSVDDCEDDEKNLHLSINDVTSVGHIGALRLFKRTINGQEALKANIIMNYLLDINGPAPDPTLPWQMKNIILMKQ